MSIFKKVIAVFLVLCVAGMEQALGQLASFSFSNTPEPPVTPWTNVPGNPYSAVLTGTSNGITVSSVSASHWMPNDASSCSFDYLGASPATYFPDLVMGNAWLQYNGSTYNQALYSPGNDQLELSGLNKDSTYILRMSSSDKYFTGSTEYVVEGQVVSSPQYLDTYNNLSTGVTFQHVKPNSSGIIKIYVAGVNNSQFAIISGIQVFSGSANVGSPAVAIFTPKNGTVISEGANLLINCTASESGGSIAKVEFFADTTKIGEVDAAPYSFTWVNPNPGNYLITARATDNVGTVSTAAINIGVESLNYFWSTTGNIATGGDTSFVGTVDTNRLAFRTNNIERMSILGDGTIGIGTKNTYGYKLAVNGNAIFTKVRIKTAGTWPDYVFKKGYVLPNLNQLEEYISLHRHLPGITPEVEVNREGFDISEQQTALLKKVEELTLYLIDENKQLKAQNKENAEQNKQITEQNARLEQQQREIDELRRLIKKK
jgi:hypothetical protein